MTSRALTSVDAGFLVDVHCAYSGRIWKATLSPGTGAKEHIVFLGLSRLMVDCYQVILGEIDRLQSVQMPEVGSQDEVVAG